MRLLKFTQQGNIISVRYNFKTVMVKELIFFLLLSLFIIIMYRQVFESDTYFGEGQFYYLLIICLLYGGYIFLTVRRLYKYRQVIITEVSNGLLINDSLITDYLFISLKHITGEYDEGYIVSILTSNEDKILFKRLPQEEATGLAVFLSDKLNIPVKNTTPDSIIPFLGDSE